MNEQASDGVHTEDEIAIMLRGQFPIGADLRRYYAVTKVTRT
jgi:hypothetical protein